MTALQAAEAVGRYHHLLSIADRRDAEGEEFRNKRWFQAALRKAQDEARAAVSSVGESA